MKWAWKLGRFAGISVYVHATFLLVILWMIWVHWRAGDSIAATLVGIAFVLGIFGCVVLHEYGHALTARRFGVRTRDIILLPIGGVARLERIPEKPSQELAVAVAGPLVTVGIAIVLYLLLQVSGAWQPVGTLGTTSGSVLERLMVVNVFLVLFNMLPAFPMDGGRVLRALLAMRTDYVRATRVAASIGQGLAFVLGFLGLFGNPFLVFIAFFVWIGAAQESSAVQLRDALAGIPLRNVMMTEYRTLQSGDSLGRAIEWTLAGTQTDFPVEDQGRLVGILTQGALMGGLESTGRETPVERVMVRDFETAEPGEMAEAVFRRLQTCGCRTIPVTVAGRLVGLVTTDNVGEFLRIQTALDR
jgi:Zn-dependent protease